MVPKLSLGFVSHLQALPTLLRSLVFWKTRSSPGVHVGATLSLPQPRHAAAQPFFSELFVCCCHLPFIFNSCRVNAFQDASPGTLLWLLGCWQPGWSHHQLGWGFHFCASLGIYWQFIFFYPPVPGDQGILCKSLQQALAQIMQINSVRNQLCCQLIPGRWLRTPLRITGLGGTAMLNPGLALPFPPRNLEGAWLKIQGFLWPVGQVSVPARVG